MTALTPQQMRWIASDREETAEAWPEYRIIAAKLREDAAALRTAADQLEAVRRLTELTPSMVHPITREPVDVVYASDLLAALTADTAPQEDRDD